MNQKSPPTISPSPGPENPNTLNTPNTERPPDDWQTPNPEEYPDLNHKGIVDRRPEIKGPGEAI